MVLAMVDYVCVEGKTFEVARGDGIFPFRIQNLVEGEGSLSS